MDDSEKIPVNSTLYKDVIAFIKSFYYAVRMFALYPAAHPKTAKSIDALTRFYNLLLQENERISFSAIKSDLLVNAKSLEESSQQVKDFANFLYESRISTITFTGPLDHSDLNNLMLIIANTDPKEGASVLVDKIAQAEIPHILIKSIDYKKLLSQYIQRSGFLAEEGSDVSDMIEHLLEAEENLSEKDQSIAYKTVMEPSKFQGLMKTVAEDANVPLDDISAMIERLGIIVEHYHEDEIPVFIENLAEVLSNLPADVRMRILGHGLERAKRSRNFVENSVDSFSKEMVKEIMQSILHSKESPDSNFLDILKRLSEHPQVNEELVSEVVGSVSLKSINPEMLQTLNELFVKDSNQSEQLSRSQNYIRLLQEKGSVSVVQSQEMEEYLKTLEEESLVHQLYKIQMEILRIDKSQVNVEAMKNGLEGLIAYMIQDETPEKLLKFLFEDIAYDDFYLEFFLTELKGYEFFEKILYSFSSFSDQLRQLLSDYFTHLGEQAVKLIVDVLANDQNMINRKRLLELLVSLGKMNVPYLIAQLKNDRWYLVRNIVIAIGEIHDDRAVQALINTLQHPHKSVVKEVILALDKIGTSEVLDVLAAFLQTVPESNIMIVIRVLLAQKDESLTVYVMSTLLKRKDLEQSIYENILPKIFKIVSENKFNAAIPITISIYKNRKRLFSDVNWGEALIFQTLEIMNTNESLDALKRLQKGTISGMLKRINPFS